jgi:hypothetical protein
MSNPVISSTPHDALPDDFKVKHDKGMERAVDA